MNEYHKIQSVYKRDPAKNNKRFLVGDWSIPEFWYLAHNEWEWTEKIDGTNVRIGWNGTRVEVGGRTDDAQMPVFLMRRLEELFPFVKMAEVFGVEQTDVMLVGEGYGAKIQKAGSLYKPDGVDFILFDVCIGGWWLSRANCKDIAGNLGIAIVPIVGRGPLLEAIAFAKTDQTSLIGEAMAEGMVMRPTMELCTRNGQRIIAKVKRRDFD